MKLASLLMFFLVIAGIYFLPSAIATFAGSHTMEWNASGNASALDCIACHQYIFEELNNTVSQNTLQAHMNAAGNASYTEGWLNLTINNGTSSSPNYVAACQLCHLAQMRSSGSHTQTVLRACIDLDCHGTNETTNNSAYPAAGMVGRYLGNVSNIHGNWFVGMSNYLSEYVNETNVNYTKGYWACLGCHTYVALNINVTEGTFAHDNLSAARQRYY